MTRPGRQRRPCGRDHGRHRGEETQESAPGATTQKLDTPEAGRPPIPGLLDQRLLYRLPWSRVDTAGAWVEVTDECNLECPGCYRHRLTGHRPFEDVKRDIVRCSELTRCDAMAIAGGEPLIYPNILDVVSFIAGRGIKPIIMTNGEALTPDLARALKRAGVAKYHFHVDSAQQRPGWKEKNEAEMNGLRQHFADLLGKVGGAHCGYNVTVTRAGLPYLPELVRWCRRNYKLVDHISIIAFRMLSSLDGFDYFREDRRIDLAAASVDTPLSQEKRITTEEMYETIRAEVPDFEAASYVSGTVDTQSFKYLMIPGVGAGDRTYGTVGPKTMELVQVFHHLFTGRYCAFTRSRKAGRKLFALSLFDPQLRRAAGRYALAVLKNPLRLFDSIRVQMIHLQQPNEVMAGGFNVCDGCVNMMVWRGKLINSCRLDEYRLFGGPLRPVRRRDPQEAGSAH
jgi:hypothetical protein